MWFDLKGDQRLGRCSTEGCGGQPIFRLEAGGIGSNYCSGCRHKIEKLHDVSSESKKEYRYREGIHGEHCIDFGNYEWTRADTIGRAVTKEDACRMVAELNTVMDGTNAKLH